MPRIEDAFVALLNGAEPSVLASSYTKSEEATSSTAASPEAATSASQAKKQTAKKKVKGDPRVIIDCKDVEEVVFGLRQDPEKIYGRKKNRAKRGFADPQEWKSVDMVEPHADAAPGKAAESDSDDETEDTGDEMGQVAGVRIRPPQSLSEVNGSIGGEKGWSERVEETPDMIEKRREGQRRAEEREMVRRAARRGCAFGLLDLNWGKEDSHGSTKKSKGKSRKATDGEDGDGGGGQETRRKCEAVMNDIVVEASFAKGDWGIRWRE
ncbi:hypothetical protein LTR04_004755 [Oleoguttula sp. CCFEE 6159]|nr:hypothetical protein LTR04_004755 [Oleoguttula sp. CCFEE 6159]